mmetsp:Transcript_87487/g.245656  ORF Transcript_87487/g.245656 Transcript_87487/m.245656 type:complete len:403 (-) Transcript_87487:14-1222(-)
MESPVFLQIAELERRREELTELAATPTELQRITKADLEELRHMARPPELVRECLELVYLALHVAKVRGSIKRLPPGGRLAIPWENVRAMLARFETFFPAMDRFDIAPLVAAPEVVSYISRTYLDHGRLTADRVRRSSAACAALFGWYAHVSIRLEAALELVTVGAELANLTRPPMHSGTSGSLRWRVETDAGWVEFPDDVDAQLNAAQGHSMVLFDLHGEHYEVDVRFRIQRNRNTRFERPIRPPGDDINIWSLQGIWQASWGQVLVVRGATVFLYDRAADELLEESESDGVYWAYGGGWRVSGGSPCCVTWRSEAVNDEGAPVRLSSQAAFSTRYYCGRRLGRDAIPGSDGRCGPNNGPQCSSCARYQTRGAEATDQVDVTWTAVANYSSLVNVIADHLAD